MNRHATARLTVGAVSLILCAALLTGALPARAADDAQTVSLSLEDAVSIMQTTGEAGITAAFNRRSDETTYQEKQQLIRSIEKSRDNGGDADLSQLSIEELGLVFLAAHREENSQAEQNGIAITAMTSYYSVLLDQQSVAVCRQSLAQQQALLAQTQRRKALGLASAADVSTQQSAVTAAENALAEAEAALETALAALKTQLGYPADAQLTLTTGIEQLSDAIPDADAAVAAALKNNLDLKLSTEYTIPKLACERSQTRYTGTSLQRDRAELTYEEQLTAEQKRPAQREQDIRTACSDLAALDAAVQSAADALAQARQDAASTQRKQALGLASGSAVRSAQLAVSNAQLAYSRAVVQYNLSAAQLLADLGPGSARVTL